MFKKIRKDIQGIKENDPAARSSLEVILLYSGFHAVVLHRPAHWLYRHGLFFLARLISQLSRFFTGIEIHPGAKIGRGVFIDHGAGVVIGETAEVGDCCVIYQGVTLGGTGKDGGKRHPTLEEMVTVGTGAKILGPFTIGRCAKIAANAVVLESIPEGATAVGVPARVVRVFGDKIKQEKVKLDHTDIPDPIANEIKALRETIADVEKRILQLERNRNNENL